MPTAVRCVEWTAGRSEASLVPGADSGGVLRETLGAKLPGNRRMGCGSASHESSTGYIRRELAGRPTAPNLRYPSTTANGAAERTVRCVPAGGVIHRRRFLSIDTCLSLASSGHSKDPSYFDRVDSIYLSSHKYGEGREMHAFNSSRERRDF